MKRLSDYRKDYYESTYKASDVARQLAFAGIALIWIFKVGEEHPFIAPQLVLSALGLAFALTFDLLQYVYKSLIWGCFTRSVENRLPDIQKDIRLEAPRWINWPTNTFFWLKIICVIFAYAKIYLYIFTNLLPG